MFVGDRRVETHSTGSETIYKFRKVSDAWAAMYAGTISRADELGNLYIDHLKGKELDKQSALEELRKPPQVLKRRLVEEFIQNTLAMSYEDFLSRGPSLPSSLYETIASEISRIEIGCQLLLIPIPASTVRLFFTVDVNGCVYPEHNFAAIGSGSANALAWLHYRNHSEFESIDRTLLHVWESKRFSENAPGVGKNTAMGWIEDTAKDHQIINFEAFEKQWKKYGPKSTKDMKIDLKSLSPKSVPWDDIGTG
jgi:20S proteasome alpha/beta subunit